MKLDFRCFLLYYEDIPLRPDSIGATLGIANFYNKSGIGMNRKQGSISGLLLAGISVVAIITAVAGLQLNNRSLNKQVEADTMTADARLIKDSATLTKIKDNQIQIRASFCYAQDLRSGGREEWLVFPNLSNGFVLEDGKTSAHIDSGKIYTGTGFPASCEYSNRDTGEADYDAERGQYFTVTATFPQPLNSDYCPDVYLGYKGFWFQDTNRFAKIILKNHENICTPKVVPSAVPSAPVATNTPTPSPTTPPVATGSIEGKISVYACSQPDAVQLIYCENATCNLSSPLRSSGTSPQEHGIWLTDSNEDNTWIYQYKISKNSNGENLSPEKTYEFKGARAYFANTPYWSEGEDPQNKLRVKTGDKRDFTIDAQKTCGCPFNAVSYIKDVNGNYISALDGKQGLAGTHNNKQRFEKGDFPVPNFPFNHLGNNSGRIDVHYTDLGDFMSVRSFGHDALASVKLIAPGYKVLRQECKSNNPDVSACPTYKNSYSASAQELIQPELFQNLRVTCGTDLDYGWIIEAKTTPNPQTSNKGELEVAVFVTTDGRGPKSCHLRTLRDTVGGNSAWFRSGCEMKLTNKNTGETFEQNIKSYSDKKGQESGGCVGYNFSNLPFGRYELEISVDHESRLDIAKQCTRDELPAPYYRMDNIEITKGEDARNKSYTAVVYQPDRDKCELNVTTGAICDQDGGDKIVRLGPSSFLCCIEEGGSGGGGGGGGGGGSSGGVCPQWCATPEYCRSRGFEPRGLPQGESCGGSNKQWCCPPGTELPGGSGGGADLPGCCDRSLGNSQCPNGQTCSISNGSCRNGFSCDPDSGSGRGPGVGAGQSCSNGQGTCKSACGSGETPFQGPGLCSTGLTCCGTTSTERPAQCGLIYSNAGTCKRETLCPSDCIGASGGGYQCCRFATREGQCRAVGSGRSACSQCDESREDCTVDNASNAAFCCPEANQQQETLPCSNPIKSYGKDTGAFVQCMRDSACSDGICSASNVGSWFCCPKNQPPPPPPSSGGCEKTGYGAHEIPQCHDYCAGKGKTCRIFSEPERSGLYCCGEEPPSTPQPRQQEFCTSMNFAYRERGNEAAAQETCSSVCREFSCTEKRVTYFSDYRPAHWYCCVKYMGRGLASTESLDIDIKDMDFDDNQVIDR